MPIVRQHWTQDRQKVNIREDDTGRLAHVNLTHLSDDDPNRVITRPIIEQEYGYRVGHIRTKAGEVIEEVWYPERESNPNKRIKVLSGTGDEDDMWVD